MPRPTWENLRVAEAALYLLAAHVALRLCPFRHLTWFFERMPGKPELTGAEREERRRQVQRAVQRASCYLNKHAGFPGIRIVCFPQAIAAQAMLRRRGVSTTLYYGAATRSGAGLQTHVWVQDGETGVVGKRKARGYGVVARYRAP